MRYGFSKLIEEIETEIEIKYLPGCIRWSDENYNNAWSSAINEFEKALLTKNKEKIINQSQIYKSTCLSLIESYKRSKNNSHVSDFFRKIKNK